MTTTVAPPRPSRRPFTPEEDRAIIAAYPHQTVKAITAMLGRSAWATVQQRINILIRDGRLDRRERYYHPSWTEAEDDYLAEHWGNVRDATVARKLGRTVVACQIRAKRHLGLARKQQFYTLRTVARLFGVDDHLVRQWVDEGLLIAVKSVVRVGNGRFAWRTEDEQIERFMREWPLRYDRKRIEPGTWWRNLADKIAEADPWVDAKGAALILGVCCETLRRWVREGLIEAERVPRPGGRGAYRFSHVYVEQCRHRLPPPRRVGVKRVALANPRCARCGVVFWHPTQYRRVGDRGVCRYGCERMERVPVDLRPAGIGMRLVAIWRPPIDRRAS